MLRIVHRVNTSADLARVPPHEGVEVDVRDHGQRLVVQHDPYADGEDLDLFLSRYRHRFIVVHLKSEGIELAVHALLCKRRISDFFFLDVSSTGLWKLTGKGVSQLAVSLSEFEPLEACLALKGRVEWVWVDSFTRFPLTPAIHKALRRHFRMCVGSPELYGRGLEEIALYRKKLLRMPVDAVCTDRADLWA